MVTAIPLFFITFTTTFAVIKKVFSADTKIGFLAMAKDLQNQILQNPNLLPEQIVKIERAIFNQHLVAFIAMFFLIVLWIIIFESIRHLYIKRYEKN